VTWFAAAALLAVAVASGRSSRRSGPVRPTSSAGALVGAPVRWRSEYGMRYGRMHQGLDLGVPNGTPIYTPLAGEVIAADPDGVRSGYGATVVVRHADGTATLYAHLERIDVRVGQRLAPGAQVGTAGQTNSRTVPMKTPAHLHFEVLLPPFRRGGGKYPVVNPQTPKRLNPRSWIQEKGIRESTK